MQGAGVKQTRSVCSPRARAAAAGRSRRGFAKQIRGFSAQTSGSKWMRCLSNLSWPHPASTDPPHRGESNSMQGAGVKQTRSVCSPRARAAAAGRSRRGFAKQIRGFSAQTISPIWMRCYRISAGHAPHQRNPKPAENRTLCRARALSKRYGNVGWDALS